MKNIKIAFKDIEGYRTLEQHLLRGIKDKYNFIISETPDFIIGSCFGHEAVKNRAVRIQYIGENICPDFNLYDYAIGFNEISFNDRYLRYPLYALAYREEFEVALDKHKKVNRKENKKSGFCSFVVSNGYEEDFRTRFFHELNRYKKVDSGGRFLNNIGECVKDKREFQSKRKFSIAMENSMTIGYTTEKIVQAWAAGAIPIYWGNPEIDKEFNDKAFINCHKFSRMDEIVEYIKEIDENDELYYSIMEEPIVIDSSIAKDYVDEKVLVDFLSNIFEQDVEKAYRRNSYYSRFAKGYEDRFIDTLEISRNKNCSINGIKDRIKMFLS